MAAASTLRIVQNTPWRVLLQTSLLTEFRYD
jgi:hypothetical protein